MKTLVTGSNGFIGAALASALEREGVDVVRATRATVGTIDGTTNWSAALQGCDAVVHLAACVHVMGTVDDALRARYHSTNVEGTHALVRQAIEEGVHRFIFVSTAKVHGEGQTSAYQETDTPSPQDAYAASKWEAEQQLKALATPTAMEWVVLRPPLVYGPNVGANFKTLLRLVARRVPLVLGCVHNQRSILYIDNLVDAIRTCLTHPAAASQTFLVADATLLSTPDIVRALARGFGHRARCIPIPVAWLRLAGALLGKSAQIARITGSFVVDIHHITHTLGWQPPYSAEEGLMRTARWYQETSKPLR